MTPAVLTVTAITSGFGILLNVAVLVLVLTQGRKQSHYLFAAVLAICAFWDLSIFLLMVRNSHLKEVELLGYAILPCGALPVLVYHFACTYIGRPRRRSTLGLWLMTFAVIGIVASGLAGRIDGVYQYPWGNIFRPDNTYMLVNILWLPPWFAITLTAVWFIFDAYRREQVPLAKRHLLYILISLTTISFAIVKVIVLFGVRNGYFLTFGMLLNDVSAAIIGVAIVKDRLFDITPVFKVGLIYSAVAALVIIIFSLAEHMMATYVAERISGSSDLLHIFSVALTIALMLPVKRRLEKLVEFHFGNKRLEF